VVVLELVLAVLVERRQRDRVTVGVALPEIWVAQRSGLIAEHVERALSGLPRGGPLEVLPPVLPERDRCLPQLRQRAGRHHGGSLRRCSESYR
jgi:hypothetical protein